MEIYFYHFFICILEINKPPMILSFLGVLEVYIIGKEEKEVSQKKHIVTRV
jgi:hypothetical protein